MPKPDKTEKLRRYKLVEEVLEEITKEREEVVAALNGAPQGWCSQYFHGLNYAYGRLINAMKGELK